MSFHFRVCNAPRSRVLFRIHGFPRRVMYRENLAPVYYSSISKTWQMLQPDAISWRDEIAATVVELHDGDDGDTESDEQFEQHPVTKPKSVPQILTISHVFDSSGVYYFALTLPYTYTALTRYYNNQRGLHRPYSRQYILGYTVLKRPIFMFIVSDVVIGLDDGDDVTEAIDNVLALQHDKRIVIVTARVHPGETPSSYVCRGILSHILGDDDDAKTARCKYIFFIVPMLNPDGVALGNFRCDSNGIDLNRVWRSPTDLDHPSVHLVRWLIVSVACGSTVMGDKYMNTSVGVLRSEISSRRNIIIDLHAHTRATVGFMYGNLPTSSPSSARSVKPPEPVVAPLQSDNDKAFFIPMDVKGRGISRSVRPPPSSRVAVASTDMIYKLPRLISTRSKHFSLVASNFNEDPDKNGSQRREMQRLLDTMENVKNDFYCYTLEAAYMTMTRNKVMIERRANSRSSVTRTLYANYMDLGGAIVKSLCEY